MTDHFDLDPRTTDWLRDGPTQASRNLVDASFSEAAGVRQASGWTLGPLRDPMRAPVLGGMPRPAPAVLVLLLALTATTLAVGALLRSNGGSVRNGPLAFSDVNAGTLQILDRPGAAPRPLTDPGLERKETSLPVFSPDGTRIAFYFIDPVALTAGVGVADLDGSNMVTFPATYMRAGPSVEVENFTWGPVDWSPDGRRVVYIDRVHGVGTIMVGDLETGAATAVPIPGGLEADSPSWSPDGQRIVLRTIDTSQPVRKTGLSVVDRDGNHFHALTASDGLFEQEEYAGPQWSPDGSTIAFQAAPQASSALDIFTIRPDGSGKTQITTSAEDDLTPMWAPDGRHLAWITGNPNGQKAPFAHSGSMRATVANVDGTGARIVSGQGPGQTLLLPFLGWSPDGAKLFTVVCQGQICDQLAELDAFGPSEPVTVDIAEPGPFGISWGRLPQ